MSPTQPRAFLIQQHRRERAARADDSAALHADHLTAPHPIRRKAKGWLLVDVDSEPPSPTAIPNVDEDKVNNIQTLFPFEKDPTSPPPSDLARNDNVRVVTGETNINSRSEHPIFSSARISAVEGTVVPDENVLSCPSRIELPDCSSVAREGSESPPSLDLPLPNPKVAQSSSTLIGQAASNVSVLDAQSLQHSSPPAPGPLVLGSSETQGFPAGNTVPEIGVPTENETITPNAVQDSSPTPVPTTSQTAPAEAANENVNYNKRSASRAVEMWNNTTSQPSFKRVRIPDITSYLLQNPNCWVNPPSRFIGELSVSRFQSLTEQEYWANDATQTTDKRRVMMHDTCGTILLFAESPTIQSVDVLLSQRPELEIVSSSYLKSIGFGEQNSWFSGEDGNADAVTSPKSAREDVELNRDELRTEAMALLELAKTSNLSSERIGHEALNSVQNVSGHASGQQSSETPIAERAKKVNTLNAAIQDVFDSDGSLSSSPKIFGLKRMQSDGRLSANEPCKKRTKVSDVSTDDDNTIASGIEILEGEQSLFGPLKREFFRLKHLSASSDSEEYGKDPTDYLHRTTEPVMQKSLPLKLRLRKRDNEEDSNMFERRRVEDRGGSETRCVSSERMNSGEHFRTVDSRSVSSSFHESGSVPSVLLRLPLKTADKCKSASAVAPGLHVYTWDISECMKSARPIDITTVCKMCATNSDVFVYHGQDTDAWKTVCTSSDIVHWANNDAPTPRRSRRIRILDVRTSKLLPFKISPTVKSLDSFCKTGTREYSLSNFWSV